MKHFFTFLISLFCLMLSVSTLSSQHFVTVWDGSPAYQPMSIVVLSATLDGTDLDFAGGDELAAFDIDTSSGSEICIGVYDDSFGFISAGGDDPSTPSVQDGFIETNPILYKVWDNSAGQEYSFVASTYQPGSDLLYYYLGSAAVSLYAATDGATWTGASGNAWSTAANWSTGAVPTAATTVVIPVGLTNYPTVSSGSCNDILLQANSSGTASILGNGNLTINGTAYVESTVAANRWNMVSPSCSGQTANDYYLNDNPPVYLTQFDENLNDYTYIANLTTPLNPMSGYMLWVNTTSNTYTYKGTMNSGTFGTTNNVAYTNQGWNLVGNPYPSAIDWDDASWTKTNVNNAIYIITTGGGWATYVNGSGTNGGSRYIAPGQGFFIRATATGTLIMTESVRVHNNVGFLKSETAGNTVKLAATNGSLTDETVIRFTNQATNQFDGNYDAYKKFATNEAYPQLFSIGDVEYAINSLPETGTVDLGFTCGQSGEYTIKVVEQGGFEYLRLEDKLTGSVTDLNNKDYTFNYTNDEDRERFLLHFNALSVDDNKLADVSIYAVKQQVVVKGTSTESGTIEVYNLLGQKSASGKLEQGAGRLNVNGKGYFLVKVVSGQSVITRKVLIQ